MPHETEGKLKDWRFGSLLAERLAAGILSVEGYADIDPQAPIGGGDGGKDILCTLDGRRFVGAVYFPPTEKTFAQVRTKFADDLDGAVKHDPYGLIFITNQSLTLAQRVELETLAAESGLPCVLYHLERVRMLLDKPSGYGLRLEFLGILMTSEDQVAFFAGANDRLGSALENHHRELADVSKKLDLLLGKVDLTARQTKRIAQAFDVEVEEEPAGEGSLPPLTSISGGTRLSAYLSTPLVLAFHRLACQGFPSRLLGRLRTSSVWIGGSGAAEATFKPPPWDQVPTLVDALLKSWSDAFDEVEAGAAEAKFAALAKFHHGILSIHPFLDGNGHVARALLEQQGIDLFGAADLSLLEQGADYIRALREADRGDFASLTGLIRHMIVASVFDHESR